VRGHLDRLWTDGGTKKRRRAFTTRIKESNRIAEDKKKGWLTPSKSDQGVKKKQKKKDV